MNPPGCAAQADNQPFSVILQNGQEGFGIQEIGVGIQQSDFRGMEIIPRALDCMLRTSSTHISKMFISKNRFLRQSYVYTEGNCASYAPSDAGEIKFAYEGVSGCCGPEVLSGLSDVLERIPKTMEAFLILCLLIP